MSGPYKGKRKPSTLVIGERKENKQNEEEKDTSTSMAAVSTGEFDSVVAGESRSV